MFKNARARVCVSSAVLHVDHEPSAFCSGSLRKGLGRTFGRWCQSSDTRRIGLITDKRASPEKCVLIPGAVLMITAACTSFGTCVPVCVWVWERDYGRVLKFIPVTGPEHLMDYLSGDLWGHLDWIECPEQQIFCPSLSLSHTHTFSCCLSFFITSPSFSCSVEESLYSLNVHEGAT